MDEEDKKVIKFPKKWRTANTPAPGPMQVVAVKDLVARDAIAATVGHLYTLEKGIEEIDERIAALGRHLLNLVQLLKKHGIDIEEKP